MLLLRTVKRTLPLLVFSRLILRIFFGLVHVNIVLRVQQYSWISPRNSRLNFRNRGEGGTVLASSLVLWKVAVPILNLRARIGLLSFLR